MATLRLPKPFTSEELEALERHAEPGPWAALTFLLETGLRSFEAHAISSARAGTWPRPGRIFGRHPDPAIRIVGKGDKERTVVLTRKALLAARVLLELGDNGRLIPWPERTLRLKLQRLGEQAGVHTYPHRCRHTWITQLVEAGNPIEVVADMAGHSSTDTTRLYYLLSESRKREAMRRRRRWLRR